jgi:hypothetical protein
MDLYLTKSNDVHRVIHINTKGQGGASDHKVLKIKIMAIDIVSKKYVIHVRLGGLLIQRRLGINGNGGVEPIKQINMDLTETGLGVKKKRIVR